MAILFNWTQIDWIKWMPVEIAVLLLLIILIRLIRRLTRWGSIKISHVREGVWDYRGTKYHSYHTSYKSNSLEIVDIQNEKTHKNNNNNNNDRILLIPPLMENIIKGNHLATAITMMGQDVIVLNHNDVQDFCKDLKNGENNNINFKNFLLEGRFSTVILFDWSIFPIFKLLGFYDNQPLNKDLSNISWVLIRPTLKWSDITSIWKTIPFTGIWFSKLRFLKFQNNFYKQQSLVFKKSASISDVGDNQRKIIFIQPSRSWLSKDGEKNLVNYQKNCLEVSESDIFQFSQGSWTFFRNETIVLGIIIQIILKKT